MIQEIGDLPQPVAFSDHTLSSSQGQSGNICFVNVWFFLKKKSPSSVSMMSSNMKTLISSDGYSLCCTVFRDVCTKVAARLLDS